LANSRLISPRCLALAACVSTTCLLGCGGGPAPVPVEGTVSLDGQPLANAVVTFDPRAAARTVYQGVTDEAGHYALQELHGSSAGAPAGNYRVTITTARPLTEGKVDESTKYSPEIVPTRYRDGSVAFEVPAAGTTGANFELQSR
jgi:hypothetical protein